MLLDRGPRTALARRRATAAAIALAVALGTSACTVQVGTPGTSAAASAATSVDHSSPSPTPSPNVVTVPLDVVHQGTATLAIVPVMIDGKGPFPFILDTGASTSGINKQLAQQLNLPQTGKSSTVSGVVSSAKIPLVHVDSWSLRGVSLKSSDLGALSFASGSKDNTTQQGSHIAGLLGSDQLSRFGSITLDYAHQQLRFTPGS